MSPLPLLLSNWRYVLTSMVMALVVYIFCHFLYTWEIKRIENAHRAELVAQAETLNAACAKDKQITTEASHGYQTQLASLRDELARVKRVQPNRCVPTLARPAPGRDAAAGNPQLPRPDGVYTDDLYDFAADAEQVGRQLDACQGFIKSVWAR